MCTTCTTILHLNQQFTTDCCSTTATITMTTPCAATPITNCACKKHRSVYTYFALRPHPCTTWSFSGWFHSLEQAANVVSISWVASVNEHLYKSPVGSSFTEGCLPHRQCLSPTSSNNHNNHGPDCSFTKRFWPDLCTYLWPTGLSLFLPSAISILSCSLKPNSSAILSSHSTMESAIRPRCRGIISPLAFLFSESICLSSFHRLAAGMEATKSSTVRGC